MRYIALVHKDEGSDYGVSFPDFPDCITAVANRFEIVQAAMEALGLHIAGMKADGIAIPEPKTYVSCEARANAVLGFFVEVQ